VNDITGAVRRRKAQFYLVEHFPMTLVEARRRLFPRQVPPFKWTIAVVSDVRMGAEGWRWRRPRACVCAFVCVFPSARRGRGGAGGRGGVCLANTGG
jgi:hypothetical protein